MSRMNALKLYGPPLILALIPSFFWAPSEYSFMLMFSFSPLIVWMARREKASEAVIGLALYFLLFDLISLRWIWTIDFSTKGWLIASMVLIILPFIQSFPFLAGFSMQRGFKNVYLLLSIPIYGVLLEGLNASLFLGFPWLNPSLALGSSILQPLGVNLLGLWGAIFIFYLSNCGLALVYFKSSNLQKVVGDCYDYG